MIQQKAIVTPHAAAESSDNGATDGANDSTNDES